eukprot:NODE_4748_length_1852_cov_4.838841.p1 GENE.NODE_4748_length_1852_cov_4.838841~~NODE_4748_length_1852_cov_4.838841.p1  ORF type:complete len:384 (-),score=85.27 NODE_4748_length_1852_cov_4.838841:339-1490(-)
MHAGGQRHLEGCRRRGFAGACHRCPLILAKMEKTTELIHERGVELKVLDLIHEKRVVDLSYLGLELKVECRDPYDEFKLRSAAWLKTRSMAATNGLTPLVFEAALLEVDAWKPEGEVPAELLKSFKAARQVAYEALQLLPVIQGDAIVGTLVAKLHLLAEIDPTFSIEVAAAKAIIAKPGEEIMQKATLRCLPAKNRIRSLDESNLELEKLLRTQLYKMVSKAAQGVVQAIKDAVTNMMSGGTPRRELFESSDFMLLVKASFAYYISFQRDIGDNKTAGVFGRTALALVIDDLELQVSNGSEVSAANVERAHVMLFLGDEEMSNKLAALTQKVLQFDEAMMLTQGTNTSAAIKRARTDTSSLETSKASKRVVDEKTTILKYFD